MRLSLATRYPRYRLGLLLGALLVPGCSEDATGPRPVPTVMAMAGGDGQAGTVGEPLDSNLSVFVTDKFGQPVPGVLVRFTASGRAGSLLPITQTTGPGGHAAARWTLPTVTGTHLATVTASGLDSVVFHAVAAPALPASLSLVTGDLQSAEAASALATAVVVLVRDGFGNPVGDTPVAFVPAAGSGRAEPALARSDSVGRAQASWILGDAPGVHALFIHVDSLPDLRVQAHALTRVTEGGFGASPYAGAEGWRPDRGESGSENAGIQRPNPGPLPALACWQNALGVSVISPVAEGETAASALAVDGCEEPARF